MDEAKFKWQDAIGIVGLLLGVGGMSDMPLTLRITCFGLCAACMPVSFVSHKNWPVAVRWIASIVVVALMGVLIYFAIRSASPIVDVTPENMTFISAGDTYDIKVRNVSDEDVYVVELLIRAKDDVGSEDDFDVEIPDESLHELEGRPHQNPPAYDVNALSCKAAEAGKRLTYLFAIDHMSPHETRHIVLNYKAGKRLDLVSKIINFETAQVPISSLEGTSRTRSIPLQEFACGGMARGYIFRPKPR